MNNSERKDAIIGLVIDMTCDNYLIEMPDNIKQVIINAYNKFDKSLISAKIMSETQFVNLDTEWYEPEEYLVVSDSLYAELLDLKRTFEESTDNEGVSVLQFERFFRDDFNENLDSI